MKLNLFILIGFLSASVSQAQNVECHAWQLKQGGGDDPGESVELEAELMPSGDIYFTGESSEYRFRAQYSSNDRVPPYILPTIWHKPTGTTVNSAAAKLNKAGYSFAQLMLETKTNLGAISCGYLK